MARTGLQAIQDRIQAADAPQDRATIYQHLVLSIVVNPDRSIVVHYNFGDPEHTLAMPKY